jgi:hypothetical protein
MLSGTVCPSCNNEVMPFLKFLREAEPTKVSRCANCDVELKRRKSVWVLLAIGGVLAAIVFRAAIQPIYNRFGIPLSFVFGMFLLAAFVLLIKLFGWLFVGWELAA